ncbi:hypothetical protein ACWC10_36840 [Streptomyces sp. NPDC001595]|uniref:hypothetical protein n=1 Tax=Streptomyces sp. NPDC001532 TaxID=3154520 RepID=UPI00332BF7C3
MPQIPSSDRPNSRIKCNSPESPPCTPWALAGTWHLVLQDVQELSLPVPTAGLLGPWKPTEDLLDRVFQQMPAFRL